mgnify:CR=1 FL=1
MMRENKNSKLLSALLAILMIFSMLPVTTFAEEEMILQEDPNQIVEENQVEEIPEEEILEEVEEAPEEQTEELIVEEKQIEEIIEVVESPQPVVENLEESNPPEEVEETIEEPSVIEEVEQINSLEEPVEEVKEEALQEKTVKSLHLQNSSLLLLSDCIINALRQKLMSICIKMSIANCCIIKSTGYDMLFHIGFLYGICHVRKNNIIFST